MKRHLRYGAQGGLRYVARDTAQPRRGRRAKCEHAVWADGRVQWRYHEEGGMMDPFAGPGDEYERLSAGGLELWKP